MSHLEPPDQHLGRPRHRARHSEAAPDAYPADGPADDSHPGNGYAGGGRRPDPRGWDLGADGYDSPDGSDFSGNDRGQRPDREPSRFDRPSSLADLGPAAPVGGGGPAGFGPESYDRRAGQAGFGPAGQAGFGPAGQAAFGPEGYDRGFDAVGDRTGDLGPGPGRDSGPEREHWDGVGEWQGLPDQTGELELGSGRTDGPRSERRAEAAPADQADPPGAAPARTGRAGRNLPAAIGVGVTMGAIVLVSLFVWRPAFLLVVGAAAGVGVWEMTRAVRHSGPRPPLVPLLGGCAVMVILSWYAGTEALVLGLVLTTLAVLIWRLADGPVGYQGDVVASVLIAVYVPFLAGFAVLLDRPHDGAFRVIVTLAAVVLSDTGGYVAGVFFGKRPMAPTVSPKKSWEGLAGSLLITAAGSAVLVMRVRAR
jgi:phosphatidate cytidylyltransferase